MIDYQNFPEDMRNLATLILRNLVVSDGRGQAFEVVYEHVDKVSIDSRLAKIHLYREDFDPPTYKSGCHENRTYSVRVGIRETVNQYRSFGQRQLGRFLQALGTDDWPMVTYNFPFKGATVTKLQDLGINDIACSGVNTFQPDEATTISEFRVTFSVAFTILTPTI